MNYRDQEHEQDQDQEAAAARRASRGSLCNKMAVGLGRGASVRGEGQHQIGHRCRQEMCSSNCQNPIALSNTLLQAFSSNARQGVFGRGQWNRGLSR